MRLLRLGRAPTRYDPADFNRIFAEIERHSIETDSPIANTIYNSSSGTTVVVGTSTTTDAVLVQLVKDMQQKGLLRGSN